MNPLPILRLVLSILLFTAVSAAAYGLYARLNKVANLEQDNRTLTQATVALTRQREIDHQNQAAGQQAEVSAHQRAKRLEEEGKQGRFRLKQMEVANAELSRLLERVDCRLPAGVGDWMRERAASRRSALSGRGGDPGGAPATR